MDELPQIWDIFIGNMSVIGSSSRHYGIRMY
ncbi:MAG: hypothetical protein V8S75_09555 [[Ruminococcus] torques]